MPRLTVPMVQCVVPFSERKAHASRPYSMGAIAELPSFVRKASPRPWNGSMRQRA